MAQATRTAMNCANHLILHKAEDLGDFGVIDFSNGLDFKIMVA